MSKVWPVISVVSPGLLALLYLSRSGEFWTQLRTYAWQPVPAIILTSEVQINSRADGAAGGLAFKYLIDGTWHEGTDFVGERPSWGDVKQEVADYVDRHRPGKMMTAYVSPDHATVSLGHFPRAYAFDYAMSGLLMLLIALLSARQAWKSRRDNKPLPLAHLPFVIALVGLLSACGTVPNATEKGPRASGSDDALPTHFSVSVGGFMGVSYKVRLEGDHLLYEIQGPGFQSRKKESVYPSRTDWMAFWAASEKVQIWNWQPHYHPKDQIDDGTQWSIELDYLDRRVMSSGDNAYPANQDPRATGGDGPMATRRFHQFNQAVSKLLGGRAFD